MSHLFCPTCSCPIFCLISLGWSNLFSTDFFLIFRSDFMSDFCPIIVRFSMSDLLYPIFLCEFFCPTCSCPIFCPIFFVRFLALFFVRFDVSSFCPIFCALFLADMLSHFWGWFLVKKDRTCLMYCHLCHVLSTCQEFLLLWQYCITARMGVIKSHNSIMALSVM